MKYPRVKELRIQSGYTQKQMAEALGWSLAFYRAREAGTVISYVDDFLAIARHYNISFDYLIGQSEEKRILRSTDL